MSNARNCLVCFKAPSVKEMRFISRCQMSRNEKVRNIFIYTFEKNPQIYITSIMTRAKHGEIKIFFIKCIDFILCYLKVISRGGSA